MSARAPEDARLSRMMARGEFPEPTSDFHVLVQNLPENCDEDDVRDLFDQFGDITNIHMPKNPETDAHCGEAVISFSLRMHADRAVDQLNGTSYRDCVLDVSDCFLVESEEEERLAAAATEDAWAVAVAPQNDAMRARFDEAAAAAAARADESELSPRLKKILHEIDSVLAEAVDAGNTHEGVYLQVANLLKKAYEPNREKSFRALFRQLLEDDGFRIADDTA